VAVSARDNFRENAVNSLPRLGTGTIIRSVQLLVVEINLLGADHNRYDAGQCKQLDHCPQLPFCHNSNYELGRNSSIGGTVVMSESSNTVTSELREKLKSKIHVAKFFAGFITLLIGFLLNGGTSFGEPA
jgi:hypothetical protein